MSRLLKLIKKNFIIIKLIILITFLYLVYNSGNINIDLIRSGISNKTLIALFLVLTFIQQYIGAIRAKILLGLENKNNLSAWDINQITWSASFVSCILPVSIASEVYKINELIKEKKYHSKDDIIYMSIFTKILTLVSLVILTLISYMLFSLSFDSDQLLIILSSITMLFFTAFLFRFKILNLLQIIYRYIIDVLNIKNQFIFNRAFNFKNYYLRLFQNPVKSTKLVMLSLIIQSLNIITFLLIIFYSLELPIKNVLEASTVIPTGIFISLLPISIQGLGTGNFAFSELLRGIGIDNGSDIFTIYFAMSYIFNFIGLIPFLLRMKVKR
ncbi:lysylphosphatidylglycerol synthase domain-containing protein [Halobacteriovorax sp. RT-1-4]|uniref:lysylphosphatidylglycerol synthase domain-containing protein n=1 Tax=unclassified Halobacteriovorax TaxID=2639665 RepID=UPI00399C447B